MDQRTRMKAEVERWRQSGLSQRAFAEELGMKLATFSYWVSRTKEAEKKRGFIPLLPGQNFSTFEMEITYPNGVRLKVGGSDLKILSQFIHLY